ncbi:MAG: tetratricopeptide repeat protein [Anaerolineae bacterium]|nr:tetratricopeptide repeat protein [Anaerolineae bacterium]
MARAVGEQRLVGWALRTLAHISEQAGDLTEATRCYEECLAMYYRAMGNDYEAAVILLGLAHSARRSGDGTRALALFCEAAPAFLERAPSVETALLVAGLADPVGMTGAGEGREQAALRAVRLLGAARATLEANGVSWRWPTASSGQVTCQRLARCSTPPPLKPHGPRGGA